MPSGRERPHSRNENLATLWDTVQVTGIKNPNIGGKSGGVHGGKRIPVNSLILPKRIL